MSIERFLMCWPQHFGVEYLINPRMEGQIHATDPEFAARQWSRLHQLLSEHGEIASIPAIARFGLYSERGLDLQKCGGAEQFSLPGTPIGVASLCKHHSE